MNAITINEENYDILIEGSDIILQGLHRDIEITNGYSDLLDEAIELYKRPFWNGEYMEMDYDGDDVDAYINDHIAEFAKDHAADGIVIDHNLN